MGGRGASAGLSSQGNKYGSQYKSLFEIDDIKFVRKKTRQSETLMETMTPGRIYAVIKGDKVGAIITFDESLKRNKVIEVDRRANRWHVHRGYEHSEYGEAVHENVEGEDKKLLDKVLKEWDNYKRKR